MDSRRVLLVWRRIWRKRNGGTMSKYITVVLEFEDIEQMPEVSVRTQALGGSVVAFSQGDCLSVLENIHAALEGQHVEHVVINDEEWARASSKSSR